MNAQDFEQLKIYLSKNMGLKLELENVQYNLGSMDYSTKVFLRVALLLEGKDICYSNQIPLKIV